MRARFALAFVALLAYAAPSAAICLVSAPNLSFGPYDGVSGSPSTTSASIVVSCDQTPPPTVTITLSPSGVSGGFFPREMRQDGGSDLLSYNFYTDPGTTSVWGDGSAGTALMSQRVMKNKPWNATIYGVIPPGQNVAAGTYSDTLTLTVNF